jgi:hypothetical protein
MPGEIDGNNTLGHHRVDVLFGDVRNRSGPEGDCGVPEVEYRI